MTPGGYQTSSKKVKTLILNEGLNSFKIAKIKHFRTKTEALDYETRFLKKVGVPYNSRFLNDHVANNFGRAGKICSDDTKTKMSIYRKGRSLGPRSPETIEKIRLAGIGKKQSAETIAKRIAKNTGQKRSLETRAKMSAAKKDVSVETRDKIKAAWVIRKQRELDLKVIN